VSCWKHPNPDCCLDSDASAERDLAIARAVAADYGYVSAQGDSYLLAIIVQVDASLGGVRESSRGQDVVQNVPASGDETQLSAKLQHQAQAADPPSDPIYCPHQNLPLDEVCCSRCHGIHEGRRAEQQRAAGILRATLDYALAVEPGDIGLDTHPGSDYDNVIKAAEQYIAAAEAAQKGDG